MTISLSVIKMDCTFLVLMDNLQYIKVLRKQITYTVTVCGLAGFFHHSNFKDCHRTEENKSSAFFSYSYVHSPETSTYVFPAKVSLCLIYLNIVVLKCNKKSTFVYKLLLSL